MALNLAKHRSTLQLGQYEVWRRNESTGSCHCGTGKANVQIGGSWWQFRRPGPCRRRWGSPVPGVAQIAEGRCGSQRACLAFDWEHVGAGGEAAPRRRWVEIASEPADTAKAGVGREPVTLGNGRAAKGCLLPPNVRVVHEPRAARPRG